MKYHFNDRDGVAHRDPDGLELDSIDDAKTTAVRLLADIITDNPTNFWAHGDHTVSVTDDRGLVLFEIMACVTNSSATRG